MKLKTVFRDEDFKLGEVVEVDIATMPDGRIKVQAVAKTGGVHTFFYNNLKTFANDWEDYEEPKEYWYINAMGHVNPYQALSEEVIQDLARIGNRFNSIYEAGLAVEKMRALKKLKDHNLKIERGERVFVNDDDNSVVGQSLSLVIDTYSEIEEDLNILLGDEE